MFFLKKNLVLIINFLRKIIKLINLKFFDIKIRSVFKFSHYDNLPLNLRRNLIYFDKQNKKKFLYFYLDQIFVKNISVYCPYCKNKHKIRDNKTVFVGEFFIYYIIFCNENNSFYKLITTGGSPYKRSLLFLVLKNNYVVNFINKDFLKFYDFNLFIKIYTKISLLEKNKNLNKKIKIFQPSINNFGHIIRDNVNSIIKNYNRLKNQKIYLQRNKFISIKKLFPKLNISYIKNAKNLNNYFVTGLYSNQEISNECVKKVKSYVFNNVSINFKRKIKKIIDPKKNVILISVRDHTRNCINELEVICEFYKIINNKKNIFIIEGLIPIKKQKHYKFKFKKNKNVFFLFNENYLNIIYLCSLSKLYFGPLGDNASIPFINKVPSFLHSHKDFKLLCYKSKNNKANALKNSKFFSKIISGEIVSGNTIYDYNYKINIDDLKKIKFKFN
jgi:hypothetical protein